MPYEPPAGPAGLPTQNSVSQPQRPQQAAPPLASQWAAYEPSQFIPSRDDFAPNIPAAPAGRVYGMYRQPPSWQHASMAGYGGQGLGLSSTDLVMKSLASSALGIGAAAVVAYVLTGSGRAAAGGAAAVIGASQIPQLTSGDFLTRAALALGGLGAAYWLLHPMMQVWVTPNEDDGDDEAASAGASVPEEPEEPKKATPWLREVK